MKTIKTATILVLALMSTAQAMASTCDLTVVPEIIERQNEISVHTLRGRRDNLRQPEKLFANIAGAVVLAPIIPFSNFFYTQGVEYNGRTPRRGIIARMSEAASDGRNNESWYSAQGQELTLECYNYIRENFSDDIISDNGLVVTARHYRCGEPYIYNYRHFAKVSVDVLYSDPVYAEMTVEQATAIKCEKLTQCFFNTNTAADIEQLQQTQIQLGCQ